jgi:hypothetical protein
MVVVGAEGAPRIKENTMNHITRRLTTGLVAAVIGTLAAAAAIPSPASAGIIIHDGRGEPTGPTSTEQATAAFPPGPTVHGAIIPCL